MTSTINPDHYGDLVHVASAPGFHEWLSMVKATGGCAEPIHLWGQSTTIHAASGEILTRRPAGRLLVACGNRRSRRCPSCSETYRADTYQLIKAGLVGGKTVPDTIAGHPRVFATFTAPSFGPVHHRPLDPNGRLKRCHPFGAIRCGETHRPDDPRLGQPLDPDTYEYVGAVMWNALATRLWARTVQLVNRTVARQLGISQRQWAQHGRVSVAKVAEYQARGLVHFHAIFRIDGPEQTDRSPDGANVDVLCDAIRQAAATAQVIPPECPADGPFASVVWGEQLDLRPIVSPDNNDERSLSDVQVAGYVAKYATKGAEASGTIDRPIACRACAGLGQEPETKRKCGRCQGTGGREVLEQANLNRHAQAMIETCWRLGGLAELEELRLRPWAHMLGFRGHFSTKSRRYSITLSCLRNARQTWRNQRTLAAHDFDPATPIRRCRTFELDDLDDPEDDTVLVVGNWAYTGRGNTLGEAIFAATIASDIAESRRIWRQLRTKREEAA